MPNVHILPENLANQVAAGEVVERPASVVKELLENSLDAGARKIEVLAQRGGIALVRVVDDGSGMGREDAVLAIQRHATSKLRTGDDLGRIGTLGFRGEALPSIASVSRFTLTTRERGEGAGTVVKVDGGGEVVVGDSGEAPGTQVEVRTLFYNVPARRKFLRSEGTEFGHLEHQVRLQAAAHPEVGFSLIHNGRLCFQLPPTGEVLDRVRGLAGGGVAERLVAVEADDGRGLKLRGYVGEPGLVRSNRSGQQFFLNRRPVENLALSNGLREGFRGALGKGSYAVAYLYLELPFEEVDVNVHPAKREVRFRDGNRVRDIIASAVAEALARRAAPGARDARGAGRPDDGASSPAAPPAPGAEGGLQATGGASQLRPVFERSADQGELDPGPPGARLAASTTAGVDSTGSEPALPVAPEGPADPAAAHGEFEFLGELESGYVLLRSCDGLVLMDRKAAHERVLFERLRAELRTDSLPSQPLLVPVTLELPARDFAFARENMEVLAAAGLVLGEFGANTFKIDAVPAALDARGAASVVEAMIHELRSGGSVAAARVGHDEIAAVVSRLSVRSGDKLSRVEIDHLVTSLLTCEMPYCNPAGRPTLIQISYREIDRKFGKSR